MQKFAFRLRQGTAPPEEIEVGGDVLDRVRGLDPMTAIEQVLASAPRDKQPYVQAMLATMRGSDSVVELATASGDEVVVVTPGSRERFGDLVSRLRSGRSGDVEAAEALEIGTAHLERGGEESSTSARQRGGNGWEAVPPGLPTAPRQPFWAAALATPLVVAGGEVWRLRRDRGARRPFCLLSGERLQVERDLSLREYDEAYLEDHGEYFAKTIAAYALGEAEAAVPPEGQGRQLAVDEITQFIVTKLIPRLRSFHLGRNGARRAEATGLGSQKLSPGQMRWRPRSLPICASLTTDCLLIRPYAYPLYPRSRRRWHRGGMPRLYLDGTWYSVGRGVLVTKLEKIARCLLEEELLREARRRVPTYLGALLQRRERTELTQSYLRLRERSRVLGSTEIIYQDNYHRVIASHGVFAIGRHVPEFILHSSHQRTYHRCGPTWLYIALRAPSGAGMFSRGCVKFGNGLQHPLATKTGGLLMNRCENDLKRLRQRGDLASALIKHLHDGKMMLEIGWDGAPPPGAAMPVVAPQEVSKLGLPVYTYRHACGGRR